MFLPRLKFIVAILISIVAILAVSSATTGALKIQIVEGEAGSSGNGETHESVGQESGVDCHQAGGEVGKEQPGLCLTLKLREIIEERVRHCVPLLCH